MVVEEKEWTLAFAVLTGIGGSIGLMIALWRLYEASRTYQFVEVVGKILACDMETSEDDPNDVAVRIRYHYQFENRSMESTCIAIGHVSPHALRRLASKANSGSSIAVFVNRDAPDEAVLIRGPGAGVYLLLISMMIVITLSVLTATKFLQIADNGID